MCELNTDRQQLWFKRFRLGRLRILEKCFDLNFESPSEEFTFPSREEIRFECL